MPIRTVRLHRVLRAPPECVYRACLDPNAMIKWLQSPGFTGKMDATNTRVVGSCKMSFTGLGAGRDHTLGGEYVELMPNERIPIADRFDDFTLPERW